MKNINVILLLICTFSYSENLTSQANFEGKIVYDLKFEDRTGQMTQEQVVSFMGTEQIYSIKGAKYKSELNGMLKLTQYFVGNDTLFNQMVGMDGIMWINVKENPDSLISYEITKNALEVNGISCDHLKIVSKEGITSYYFNTKYSVDPKNFENHEYGFWKFCIEKTKSLPLKSISDTKSVYFEITAKEIIEMNIDEKVFKIPLLPRIESPEK